MLGQTVVVKGPASIGDCPYSLSLLPLDLLEWDPVADVG